MTKGLRVAVFGMVGQSPFAGVAWQALHYLCGFRRLGCEVSYVEDTWVWPYDPEQDTVTSDCTYTVKYIARLMDWCGLQGRWAYRDPSEGNPVHGMSASQFSRLLESTDVLVNVPPCMALREEYLRVPVRIYIETDPGLNQVELARGVPRTTQILAAHTHHFTYAENLGAADCKLPSGHISYKPTRQPIVLDWWTPPPPGNPVGLTRYTTVASWQQSGGIEWEGETYPWSKHHEFLRFLDLPRRTGVHMELALACLSTEAVRLLESSGWRVVNGVDLSKDIAPYREYVLRSRAEFTVAKPQYTRTRSGWFSDRTASYLAAGRPVITQETGFSRFLPTGQGLFAFETLDDILKAVEAIEADYEGNSRKAREIAAEYFAAEKVLGELMNQAGL